MAVDYFLKIDGIDGESQDAQYKDHIQLETWSFGVTQTGTSGHGGGMGGGKANFNDFHFTMKVNQASAKAFLACADGTHIGKAQLFCRKAGGGQKTFDTWTFTDLLISSFNTGGTGSSDDLPIDSISFNYKKIENEYKTQDEKGNVGKPQNVGYNLKENKKV
jgi:type VI secretion system secreted protein Hcp